MLASLAARRPDATDLDEGHYSAWSASVRRLRDDWNEQGRRVEVRDLPRYVESLPEPHRRDALYDLIAEHLRITWSVGSGLPLDCYAPLLLIGEPVTAGLVPEMPSDLVEDELLARYQAPHGDAPSLHEFQRRFDDREDVAQVLDRRFLNTGRFVLLHRVGRGAVGDVWRAVDRATMQRAAVKILRAELRSDPVAHQRFVDEGRLTAGLHHPGIASVYHSAWTSEGAPFHVMRYADGQTLGKHVVEYHQSPDRDALRRLLNSFITICDAVAHAHAHGIVHRDLKPGNVQVGGSGGAVVLDWGLAQRVGPAGKSEREASASVTAGRANIVGTPQYMAPEQVNGRADVRSDVFGLGGILYEILTGRPPHDWPTDQLPATWRQIVQSGRFPRPHQLVRRVPRPLETVCLKAMAANPADRYPTALAVAHDVQRYITEQLDASALARFVARMRKGRS